MKKHCTNNLAIIVLLGLFSSTLTYGRVHHIHNTNKNHINNSLHHVNDWPTYDSTIYNTDSKKERQDNTIIDKKLNIDKTNNDEKIKNKLLDFQMRLLREELSEKTLQISELRKILNQGHLQIKQLEDEIEEKRLNYYILFTISSIISIASIMVISFLLIREKIKMNNKDNCILNISSVQPDIDEIENLIQQSNSLKYDFKNIQHESDLTIFTKFDLLKDDFYHKLNKVDWNQNQNKLLVEKYQLLVSHYVKEMTAELNKIHDKFNQLVTENINQTIDKIKIIQQS